jgi:NAD(P)-dependent dehydrogenase (short-subunit alcohol dehydrogenase family)
MIGRLSGRSAVITGASHGLGAAIASAYVEAGADVLLCARHGPALEETSAKLAAAAPNRRILTEVADVSSERDVERLCARAVRELPDLHILVNNAGVYGPMGAIEDVDWREWVDAITINLMGSVLMCRALVPHFKKRRGGKIIQLSGGGATNPLPRISAYAASKAAVVRFAETLAEEMREYNIDVNSVAPGALNTRLLDEVFAAGPERVGRGFYERALKQKEEGGVPLSTGADLCVFLASPESDGITGKLISAKWDRWREFPSHLKELESDVFTLRRTVPEKPW